MMGFFVCLLFASLTLHVFSLPKMPAMQPLHLACLLNCHPASLPPWSFFTSAQASLPFPGRVHHFPWYDHDLSPLALEITASLVILRNHHVNTGCNVLPKFSPSSLSKSESHHNKPACLGCVQMQARGNRVPCSHVSAVLPKGLNCSHISHKVT